jgi:hypothetical protein
MPGKLPWLLAVCLALAAGGYGSSPVPPNPKGAAKTAAPDPNPAMTQPDKYAWQLFIELNRPAQAGGNDVLWETWATDRDTFPDKPDPTKPPQWPGDKARPKTLHTATQLLLAAKLRQKFTASVHPLAEETGGGLEEVHRNRANFDYIVNNQLWYREGLLAAFKKGRQVDFPLGAIAVKAKWRAITAADKPRYHWNVDAKGKLFGLIALHISAKELPNWFWATFEHVDNADRGKDLGCHDSFGTEPPSCCSGKVSLALRQLLKNAHMGPQWHFYRLDGSQIDFTDSTGRPTLLGNSAIEGPQGVMLTSSCLTCHSKAGISVGGFFLPIEKQSSPPEGDVGAPDPNWFFNSTGARKILQLGFTWGFLNASSIQSAGPGP